MMAKRSLVLMGVLLALMVSAAVPATAQEEQQQGQYGGGETVTVTFGLTVRGEVPEGRLLSVYYPEGGMGPGAYVPLCVSPGFFEGAVPKCEDGGTYTGSLQLPKDEPVRFFFGEKTYGAPVVPFFDDTRAFAADETVSATYAATRPPAGQEISATGVLLDGLPADVGAVGTHSITDEATGTLYALRSAGPDLGSYSGQRVTVHGALTPGEEGTGQGDFGGSGSLPSIDVTRVEPAGGTERPTTCDEFLPGGEVNPDYDPTLPECASGDGITTTFELAAECEPPAGATFYGLVGQQPTRLTDPDGDGTYTGSLTLTADFGTFPIPVSIISGDPAHPQGAVKDFGKVVLKDGDAFKASASFCGATGTGDGSGNGGTTGGGGSGSGTGGGSSVVSGDTNDANKGGGVVSGDVGNANKGGGSADAGGNGSADASANASGGAVQGSPSPAAKALPAASGSTGIASSAAKAPPSSVAKVLPDTGGMALPIVGAAGALLIAGGLLVRRIFR